LSEQHLPLDEWLAEKRETIDRFTPEEAYYRIQMGAKLVDIRYLEQRLRDGVIPGAIQINTNELEWRCNPSSPDEYRNPQIDPGDLSQPIIVICNQGYQSSVKAASLREIGIIHVGDVKEGFEGWNKAGLPVKYPNLLHKAGASIISLANKLGNF
jgi:rhodanese-related sulfurtransferase